MADEGAELDVPLAAQLARVGERLRELRAGRGWTLEELAERTGLSKAFLSRLEAGDRQPSIAAVLTLARAYDVGVGTLFDAAPSADACVIVRKGQPARRSGDGLSYVPLSNTARFANLQPIRLTISARRRGDERYQHDGEEWLFVTSGRVRLSLGEREYDLNEGDAAHFDSRSPHRLTALDARDAELILVACPLPETGAGAIEPAAGNARRKVLKRRAIR